MGDPWNVIVLFAGLILVAGWGMVWDAWDWTWRSRWTAAKHVLHGRPLIYRTHTAGLRIRSGRELLIRDALIEAEPGQDCVSLGNTRHVLFDGCTLKAGVPGERLPDWSLLLGAAYPPFRYALPSAPGRRKP